MATHWRKSFCFLYVALWIFHLSRPYSIFWTDTYSIFWTDTFQILAKSLWGNSWWGQYHLIETLSSYSNIIDNKIVQENTLLSTGEVFSKLTLRLPVPLEPKGNFINLELWLKINNVTFKCQDLHCTPHYEGEFWIYVVSRCLPFTLIPHNNIHVRVALQKHSNFKPDKIWKHPASHFSVHGKHFENGGFWKW